MLSLIGSLISGGILGGITGLLGSVVQRFAAYKTKKLEVELEKIKFDHETALRELDARIMEKEWAGRAQVASVEGQSAADVAAAEAFAKSYTDGPKYSEGLEPTKGQAWLLVLLDCLRGVIRPALTIYLCVITTMVYLQAQELMGGDIPQELAAEIVRLVLGTILYLTTTCVTWWFGTRNIQTPPKSLGGKN